MPRPDVLVFTDPDDFREFLEKTAPQAPERLSLTRQVARAVMEEAKHGYRKESSAPRGSAR